MALATNIINPPPFVPAGQRIGFPPGTVMQFDGTTWALYVNQSMNRSWIGYALPRGGTRIVSMGGVRRVTMDMGRLDAYVKQKQATGCCD